MKCETCGQDVETSPAYVYPQGDVQQVQGHPGADEPLCAGSGAIVDGGA